MYRPGRRQLESPGIQRYRRLMIGDRFSFHPMLLSLLSDAESPKRIRAAAGRTLAGSPDRHSPPPQPLREVAGLLERRINGGDDTVGWHHDAVIYYRMQGRAPCQTEFPQRMVIDCGTGKRTYVTNLLRMGFDSTMVWSERAGQFAQRVWPLKLHSGSDTRKYDETSVACRQWRCAEDTNR